MAKRRRRRIRRIRYAPRRRHRTRRNPGLPGGTMLWVIGGGVAAFFLWKKYKAAPAPATVKPAGGSASVTVGGTTVSAQLPTSGYGSGYAQSYGTLGTGGLGSLG